MTYLWIETNLKKQGILPLTFANPSDYDKITRYGKITTMGLKHLSPHSHIQVKFQLDKQEFIADMKHTMSQDQIEWFKAGSALNRIAQQ